FTESAVFPVVNRTWSVVCVPSARYLAAGRTWQPWFVLLAGLAFTGGLAGYVRARRHAEVVLRETTQTLQALVQSAPVGITMIGRWKGVCWWNPAAERMFGWSRGEVLGKPLLLAGPRGEDDSEAAADAILRGQTYADVETRRCHKDGQVIEVSLSAAPL